MIIRECEASDVKSIFELIKTELDYSEITDARRRINSTKVKVI